MNTFIQQQDIKLINSDSKDIYIVILLILRLIFFILFFRTNKYQFPQEYPEKPFSTLMIITRNTYLNLMAAKKSA